MSKYSAADKKSKWLWSNPRHYPENAYLKSQALKEGGLLCNRSARRTRLDTAAYISFSVGFAALLLRHLLDGDAFEVLRGTKPIGVVTGFDSGDLVRLGEITAEGFAPNPRAMT